MKNNILKLLILATTLIIGCKDDEPVVTDIKIDKTDLTIKIDESSQLTVSHNPSNLPAPKYEWTSSDDKIITVSQDGLIKGISIGEATITVTNKEKTLSSKCKVKVDPVNASLISLNKNELDLKIGGEETLTCTIKPDNATYKDVEWSISDPNIAKVDNTGKVTALNVGETTVTATSSKNNMNASCKIKVSPIDATELSLNKSQIELLVGGEETLIPSIKPDNTTYKEITWSSSDPKIATIDNTGKIAALNVGETTVTATNSKNNISASCKIKVSPIKATELSLNKSQIELLVGGEETLTPSIKPYNTTYKEITWTSSDPKIATIDNTGKIKGINAGEVTITVSLKNGDLSTTCHVKILPINVTGISLLKNEVEMEVGEKQFLIATIFPDNATNKNIIWESSTQAVSVSTSGEITAISEGNSVVTATTEDGKHIASCQVHVKPISVKGISLDKTFLSLLIGKQETIHPIINPTNAANQNIVWTSTNSDIVSVDANGVITTSKTGSSIIRATSVDGSFFAECTVNVNPITQFQSLRFRWSSLSIINGFVTGDMYSEITNTSSEPIRLTAFYIYDGNSGRLVATSSDPNQLGTLNPGTSKNLGMKFNSVYLPIFKWKFEWNGVEYEVQHQYDMNKSASIIKEKQDSKQLNLIK